jgi:hypothetical protein
VPRMGFSAFLHSLLVIDFTFFVFTTNWLINVFRYWKLIICSVS